MRDLLTSTDDVDPFTHHASLPRSRADGQPWVLVNMVASVDGGVTVDGRSGGLGGPADRRVFTAIRAVADTILVGAGTVRAEGYRPPKPDDRAQAWRKERGWAPAPAVAVISGRLDLDPDAPLFADAARGPTVITTERAEAARATALEPHVSRLIRAGEGSVDLSAALTALGRAGASVVLCEGGPSINGQLLAAGLVDELCLTVSPLLVSGDGGRIARGAAVEPPSGLALDSVLEEDSALFLRYLRASPS